LEDLLNDHSAAKCCHRSPDEAGDGEWISAATELTGDNDKAIKPGLETIRDGIS